MRSSRLLRPLALSLAAATGAALLFVTGLVGLPSGSTQAADYHPEWGSTAAVDGELLRGCHSYSMSYALTPPEGQWALEVVIVGPQGESVASLDFVDGADPVSGSGTFKLCVPTTHSGVFTINAKLSVDGEGTANHVEGYLTPTTFRLDKLPRDKHEVFGLGPIRVLR